jgi:DNA-binding transcriptional LysR family regulator
VTWEDLRDEPFVYREAGSATRHFLEQLLQARKLQVNVTTELQGNETIKQAVMAGMGISFMSAHAFQVELETGRLVILNVEDMPKVLDWYLLYRRDSPLSGINALFRTFLLEHGARILETNQAHPSANNGCQLK